MSGEEYRVDLLVEAARMYYENSPRLEKSLALVAGQPPV